MESHCWSPCDPHTTWLWPPSARVASLATRAPEKPRCDSFKQKDKILHLLEKHGIVLYNICCSSQDKPHTQSHAPYSIPLSDKWHAHSHASHSVQVSHGLHIDHIPHGVPVSHRPHISHTLHMVLQLATDPPCSPIKFYGHISPCECTPVCLHNKKTPTLMLHRPNIIVSALSIVSDTTSSCGPHMWCIIT